MTRQTSKPSDDKSESGGAPLIAGAVLFALVLGVTAAIILTPVNTGVRLLGVAACLTLLYAAVEAFRRAFARRQR